MLRRARWWIALVGSSLSALAGASAAGAYPIAPVTPHRSLSVPLPPTTEECEASYGIACYSPKQLAKAYGMPTLWGEGFAGQGQTIVIVDCFGSPTIQRDLTRFDESFGLPAPPSLKVIAPAGKIPPFNPKDKEMTGWALETSLDVEYAHAMAPAANILLVATPEAETEGVTGFPPIVEAENYVIKHHLGSVISQSFGATEETFPNVQALLSLRSAYINAASENVTVLAASGDYGSTDFKLNGETLYRKQVVDWPSSDPLVTSVGGTQLHLSAAGERTAPDNVWNDIPVGIDAAGGGGPSHVFPRPNFQKRVATGAGEARATPDISMSAAVNGGALVYTSYPAEVPGEPAPNTFSIIGGTSAATPLFSGVVSIADQIAGHPLGWINPQLYGLESGITDITKGNNTFTQLSESGKPLWTVPGWNAHKRYDMASGLGTVDGPGFAHALAGR